MGAFIPLAHCSGRSDVDFVRQEPSHEFGLHTACKSGCPKHELFMAAIRQHVSRDEMGRREEEVCKPNQRLNRLIKRRVATVLRNHTYGQGDRIGKAPMVSGLTGKN